MIDDGNLALLAAMDVSYLTEDEQKNGCQNNGADRYETEAQGGNYAEKAF